MFCNMLTIKVKFGSEGETVATQELVFSGHLSVLFPEAVPR